LQNASRANSERVIVSGLEATGFMAQTFRLADRRKRFVMHELPWGAKYSDTGMTRVQKFGTARFILREKPREANQILGTS
jgi:hypothetical protein